MWISSDQTELHQAHRTASRIAEQFRLTLESIGDGVIATDSEERITLLNPIAVQMTGYTTEEARGKKLNEVFNIISYLDGRKVESPLTKALSTGKIIELANHTDLIARDGTAGTLRTVRRRFVMRRGKSSAAYWSSATLRRNTKSGTGCAPTA